MYKEIEEAREWISSPVDVSDGKETLDDWHRAINVVKNLLALFDRMQQEPVVEVENRDEKIFVNIDLGPSEMFKTQFLLVELRDAEHVLPYGRYRRELEGGNNAK